MHSQCGTLSDPSSNRTSSNCLSHKSLPQVADHTNFVQEEPLDLQWLPMIRGIYVMEDVSKRLELSDPGILSNLLASSNFT